MVRTCSSLLSEFIFSALVLLWSRLGAMHTARLGVSILLDAACLATRDRKHMMKRSVVR